MSIKDRVRRLEERIGEPEDEGAAMRSAIRNAVLDELGRLKASRAVQYRGGPDGPTRIEPEDIPGKILGPSYTRGELIQLAIRRALVRLDMVDEELIGVLTRTFRRLSEQHGLDWNKVEEAGGGEENQR
jgi:hypothetical protein